MTTHQKVTRTIWVKAEDPTTVQIIDQRQLPHHLVIEDLQTADDVARAIRDMHVRGAPLIGVAAAFGMYLAALDAKASSDLDASLQSAGEKLKATRPTAVNLETAVVRVLEATAGASGSKGKVAAAFQIANQILEEEVDICKRIGEHGFGLVEKLNQKKKGKRFHFLTHCNAGWLACVEWGTATSPIYHAFDKGIDLHVWVDETRPRNQGARLTAWELGKRGISHAVISDSSAGHLMQRGMVDMIVVGTDRTTATGDVANKIGTYMVALAAKENQIPFYVAVPSSSIDWTLRDGIREIPIEERSLDEVTFVQGACDGEIKQVRLTPEETTAVNYAFDVTPRKLITGLITERGVSPASQAGLEKLFPEKKTVPARHE